MLDNLFPAIGGIDDRYRGEERDAPETVVSVYYTERLRLLCCRNGTIGRRDYDLDISRKQIVKYRERGVEVFTEYQPSGMRTSQRHLVDHLIRDVKIFGGIQFIDARLYEYTHVLFKIILRQTSKRSSSSLEESVRGIGMKKNLRELTMSQAKTRNPDGMSSIHLSMRTDTS